MPLFNNVLAGAAGSGGAAAYKIERSLRFNSADSANLSKTFSSEGNRRTFTFSCWVKRTKLARETIFSSGSAAGTSFGLEFNASDKLDIYDYNSSFTWRLQSTAVFRDPASFFHLVLSVDTTQATASNRVKVYINGSQVDNFDTANYPSQNHESFVNDNVLHTIGSYQNNTFYSNPYLTDVHFIDGQALAATDFGEYDDNNVWQPKKFAGNYTLAASGTIYNTGVSGSVAGSPYDATKMFDGSLTTYTDHGSANSTITWTHTLNSVTSLRVYINGGNSTNTVTTVGGNGTQTDTISANFGPGWHTISLSSTGSTINSIAFTRGGSGNPLSIYAIEVNGTVLVDGTTAQGANSFHLDFSDNSSNAALGTDAAGSNDWTVNNLSVSSILNAGNAYNGSLNGYMPSGVAQATSPTQLADTSNRTHFFVVGQNNTLNITVVATATSITTGSSVYDSWGANDPTTTLNDGTITPNSSGTDSSVSGKNLATNTFTGLTVGNTYTISTKNGGAGNPHRVHYVTGATVQNQPVVDTDSLRDSPTNYEAESGNNGGNYCTFNPVSGDLSGGGVTMSNGNLEITRSGGTNRYYDSTMSFSSGKWYWEMTVGPTISSYPRTGIWNRSGTENFSGYPGQGANGYVRGWGAVGIAFGAGGDISSGLPTFTVNDTLMFAMDLDNGKMWFGKNGTWYSTGTSTVTAAAIANNTATARFTDLLTESTGTSWTPIVHMNSGDKWIFNPGSRAFLYTPPTGFKSLCTQNLSDPPIPDGSAQFGTKLYTSNNASLSVTGYEFSPSFVWIKNRASAQMHGLFDVVRGVNQFISSNRNNAQNTTSGSGYGTGTFNSFDSNGFTLGDDAGQYTTNYPANQAHVAWAWNAGTNSNKTYTVKVIYDSGNKYRLDNHGTSAVTLDLAEGSTYIFDQSDSSNAGHPIRFGTSANGTDYTTGVTHTGTPGSAGAKTTLVLGTGVATLYYSCANHSGMGGQINTNSTAGSTRLSGEFNTYILNQSAVWSGMFSTAPSYGSPERTFNGEIGNQPGYMAGGGSWVPTGGFTYYDKVEVIDAVDQKYAVNGGTQVAISQNVWTTIASTTNASGATLTSIDFTRVSDANTTHGPQGIRIDGRLLVDSNIVADSPSTNSIVQANPEAGFSIIKYLGDNTLGTSHSHGLNSPPSLIVVKNLDSTDNWAVYHKDMGANKYLQLNTIAAMGSNTGWWNDTDPTSSVFYTGNASTTAGNNQNHIAFCMSPVNGYSAMGSYTGNGTSKFIYTGFKVRFLLTKAYSANSNNNNNWTIYDADRDTNENQNVLYPNSATFENSHPSLGLDLLSNGFALKADVHGYSNYNGWDYIYLAFASHPFKTALAS